MTAADGVGLESQLADLALVEAEQPQSADLRHDHHASPRAARPESAVRSLAAQGDVLRDPAASLTARAARPSRGIEETSRHSLWGPHAIEPRGRSGPHKEIDPDVHAHEDRHEPPGGT